MDHYTNIRIEYIFQVYKLIFSIGEKKRNILIICNNMCYFEFVFRLNTSKQEKRRMQIRLIDYYSMRTYFDGLR